MNNSAIGIFDSGVGGLTVVKELKRILPHENLVYFGDTGRVPYGTRSRQTIIDYAKQDLSFLKSKKIKMAIAACGTVSAVLPNETIDELPFPYTGVLLPAVQTACSKTISGHIGVLGTSATIRSGAYGKAIRTILPGARITGIPCPLFVSLVENGYVQRDNQVTRLVAQDYLKQVLGSDIDTLILGCTHFPLLKAIIGDIVGPDVRLIDPGRETARFAASVLTSEGLLNTQEERGSYSFFVSDSPESFTESANLFLGDPVNGHVEQILL